MTSDQSFRRMFDGSTKPSDEDIKNFIEDEQALKAWMKIQEYLESRYNLNTEMRFYGNNYGWLVRYRKSGKTVCSLFPEKGGFSFLIVFGKKEIDRFIERESEFTRPIIEIFYQTNQLHDGKWLWIRVTDMNFYEDIKQLLAIKRKPKKPEEEKK